MAGDGRAADGALVARRRDDDRAAAGGVARRFFQLLLFVGDGDATATDTEVDDPRTGIDALGDRIGGLVRGRARHLGVIGCGLRENRPDE
jgi:hypothetical protein